MMAAITILFGIVASMSDNLWYVGVLILVLVAFQCALVTVDLVRRIVHENAQQSREADLLELRLAAVRKRRDAQDQQALAWNGWRKFTIARRVPESADVCSFYLKPHDGKALPAFRPGQYLTFRLQIPGQDKPVVRCYSLSDCVREDYYRVSIRRVGTLKANIPPGLASCFFHDQLREGEIVDVKAPSGSFCLDLESTHPVVFLAAGIGITPLLSMLNALVASGPLSRRVHFFYGVGSSREHSFREHLEKLAQVHEQLNLHTSYSRPLEHDTVGTDYHTRGHVSIDLLKKNLPSNNFHFYLCGPPAMMETLIKDLKEWGVPETHIHSEAFGAPTRSAIAKVTGTSAGAAGDAAGEKKAGAFAVEFARSGRTEVWRPGDGTLLEFAEKHQVSMACGCRAGNCGTCIIAIRKGEVSYQTEPGFQAENGSCLTCCCIPKSELVLDA